MKPLFRPTALALCLSLTTLFAESTAHSGLYEQNLEEQKSQALANIVLIVPSTVELEIKPQAKKLMHELDKTEKIKALIEEDQKYKECRLALIDTQENNAQITQAKNLFEQKELNSQTYQAILKRLKSKNATHSTKLKQCKKTYKGLL